MAGLLYMSKNVKKLVFSVFLKKHGPDRVFSENAFSGVKTGPLGTCPGDPFFHVFSVFDPPIWGVKNRYVHTPENLKSGYLGYPNFGFSGTQEPPISGVPGYPVCTWISRFPGYPGNPEILGFLGTWPGTQETPIPGHSWGIPQEWPGNRVSWPIWPGNPGNLGFLAIPGPYGQEWPGIGSRDPESGPGTQESGPGPQVWGGIPPKPGSGPEKKGPMGAS